MPGRSREGRGRAAHRPGGRALDARRDGGVAQGAPQDRRAVADSERAAGETAAPLAPRRRRAMAQGECRMTEFEQKVAKALQELFYEWRENPPPEEQPGFGEYAAPRVAAAILAAAYRDKDHAMVRASSPLRINAALAALRGEKR